MIVGSITATDFIREPAIHYYLLIGNGLMKKNRKMVGKACLRMTKNNQYTIAVNLQIECLQFFKEKRQFNFFALQEYSRIKITTYQVLNKKSVSCCFFKNTNLGRDHWELAFFGAICLFPEWRRATFLSTSRKTSSTRRSSRKRNRTLIGRKSTEKTEVACDRWRQSGIGWCSDF